MNNAEQMPIENFEDEALAATQNDRMRRQCWMEALQMRDDRAEWEREIIEREDQRRQAEMERLFAPPGV